MARKLVLTGFMATGKTSVGQLLAERLTWRLFDTDAMVARRAGKSIPAIFREDGETRLRELERAIVAELCRSRARCAQCGAPRPAIIATGGGVLVDDANYAALACAGVIVCLSARPEIIMRRLAAGGEVRPKLLEGGKTSLARVIELLERRRPYYARAPLWVDTSDLTVEEAAERVLALFTACQEAR